MKIGFNITDSVSYKTALQLADTGSIDFCEILIDNFMHLNPDLLLEKFSGLGIGFHIMKSEFIEKDYEQLKEYSSIVREFAAVLKPLYISDHLARFNIHTKVLPITAEIDYKSEYTKVVSRVQQWQEMLGSRILLENFPSRAGGTSLEQVDFFDRLMSETGSGLLFDLSNAVAADLNGGATLAKWTALKTRCEHFHVAGFRTMGKEKSEQWILDSHDGPIAEETLIFANSFFKDFTGKSIVIERDANLDIDSISKDIKSFKKSLELK